MGFGHVRIRTRRAGCRCLGLLLFASACLGGSSGPGGSRTDRNQIASEELRASDADNLYAAVQALRPQWLVSRGPSSAVDPTPTFPHVAVNGTITGEIDALRDLAVSDVATVRFLPPGEASARYGMGHVRGVIEATTRRSGPGSEGAV